MHLLIWDNLEGEITLQYMVNRVMEQKKVGNHLKPASIIIANVKLVFDNHALIQQDSLK